MQKDFDGWNEEKKKTNEERSRLYTVREIWWCRLGVNVGTEQDGKGDGYARPCVILRGFGPDACLIVPLTTSTAITHYASPLGWLKIGRHVLIYPRFVLAIRVVWFERLVFSIKMHSLN